MREGGREGRKRKGREEGKRWNEGSAEKKEGEKGMEGEEGNKESHRRRKRGREEGKEEKKRKSGVIIQRSESAQAEMFRWGSLCFAAQLSFCRMMLHRGADSDCKTAFAEENLSYQGVQAEAIPTMSTGFVP